MTWLGRVDRLQLNLLDENAGAIAVEHLLHPLLHVGLDGRAVGGENAVDRLQADDLAHDALGHRLDRLAWVEDVEHVVFRLGRVDLPVHPEMNVDDILVPGQHLAFFGNVGAPAEAAIAHFGDLLIPDRNLDHRTDRPGPIGVQAGGRLAGVAAEHEIDADFARLDGIERSPGEPEQESGEQEEQRPAAAKPLAAAWARSSGRQLAKGLLDAADDLLEVARRLRARAAPGPTARGPASATGPPP